jgi:hypothetical protein
MNASVDRVTLADGLLPSPATAPIEIARLVATASVCRSVALIVVSAALSRLLGPTYARVVPPTVADGSMTATETPPPAPPLAVAVAVFVARAEMSAGPLTVIVVNAPGRPVRWPT